MCDDKNKGCEYLNSDNKKFYYGDDGMILSILLDTFSAESIEPDTLGIKMLRRGVIGISRIGYIN